MKSILPRLLALAGVMYLPFAAAEGVFLSTYTKAQPVIKRAVEAYGGAEAINGITSVYYRADTTTYQRYQSPRLGPPFQQQAGYTEIAYDIAANSLLAGGGNNLFNGGQIVRGEEGIQFDGIRRVYNENSNPPVPAEHFVHRIVPALMVRKLNQRAQTVTLVGESKFGGKTNDVLSVPWENGNLYMVHIDRASGLVTRYDILFGDFVAGDAVFESYFEDYKDVDGVPMPMRRWQKIAGQMTFNSTLTDITFNSDLGEHFANPDSFAQIDPPPPPESELRQLADGVYIGNGNYQNLYIEMDDYIVSVDAGGGTGLIRGDLAQLETRTGGKPLRYAILTHHHSDHTVGVPALVETGARLVTTAGNEAYLSGLIKDRKLNAANVPAVRIVTPEFELVGDRHTIGDGDRRIEIFRVPNEHAEDYLVVYLPASRLLYGADVFNLPATGPLAPANDQYLSFYDNLSKLNLDVDIVANSHGRTGTGDELRARAEKRVAAN
jgi:glyoxylase-like metal-dependent hydrolase (beta-lactamase superfamily II)